MAQLSEKQKEIFVECFQQLIYELNDQINNFKEIWYNHSKGKWILIYKNLEAHEFDSLKNLYDFYQLPF